MDKFIYPYTVKSKSVVSLAKGLGAKIIKLADSKFVHSGSKIVINWGSSALPLAEHAKNGVVLNRRASVMLCANKQRFFKQIEAAKLARAPAFTEDREEARRWAVDGKTVVARAVLNGHSGEGIIFSTDDPDFYQKADFFTEYVPKKDEFRVHVFRGNVLDVQQKKMRKTDEDGREVNKEDLDWRVRSYKNGFIFAREDIKVPDDVITQALGAFNSIPGLDFGAVDVIYNRKQGMAYVLEINTAPGLEGQTLESYIRAFNEEL